MVGPGAPDRRQLVTRAAQRWAEELVDVSGRDNLLFLRDLRGGTLDVTEGDLDAMNRLLSGQRVRLGALLPPASGDATDPNRRLRAIARTAAANYEERGLRTAHLMVGLARWSDPSGAATLNAPILLCPLSIVAVGAGGSDHELELDGDWTINPTLRFRMRHDFGIVISDVEPTIDPDDHGWDVDDVRDALEAFAVEAQRAGGRVPDLSIDPRGLIGNVSGATQTLADDLERSIDALIGHPLISALAGDPSAHAEVRSRRADVPRSAPDEIAPSTEFLVLDADSSQHHAINAALAGADVVIQGPPGTGKSQTIANLIAALVAQRTSVLFVADKRAAIDAVTDRLIDVELADLVMDLHDGVGSRRRVATGLADALAAARDIPAVDREPVDAQLVERRRRLAEHDAAMNAPRAPWGVSVFDLQAEQLGVAPEQRFNGRIAPSGLPALTLGRIRELSEQLREWVDLGGPSVADPVLNPWASAAQRVQRPDQASALIGVVDHLIDELLPGTANLLRAACDAAGLREPHELDGWVAMFELLDEVARLAPALNPYALDNDLSGYVSALAPATQSGIGPMLSSLFDSGFRSARTDARGWVADPTLPLVEVRQLFIRCGELRDRWAALSIDGSTPRIPPEASPARESFDRLVSALGSLGAWIDRDDLVTLPFHEIDRVLRTLSDGRSGLVGLPRLLELRSALVAAGLAQLLDEVVQRRSSAQAATVALQIGWVDAVLSSIAADDPAVASIEGSELSRLEHEFRVADASQIRSGRDRVRRAWAEWVASARGRWPHQVETLAWATRRPGDLPLRELFATAPDVMLALTPCWAMSPLAVSQLLPSVAGIFDVVIFDEASQIAPAEAIPALLRAKRAVVVGDSRQLPPAGSFATGLAAEPHADAELDGSDVLAAERGSILDAMAALLDDPQGSHLLTWHHRCVDERLIAFSNAQPSLYGGSMLTCPGVVDDCLRLVVVDESDPSPLGASGADAEVRRVVELIAEHARLRPDESLGVIALSVDHAERIDEALRIACTEDPVLEQLVVSPRLAPLFVKDVERVQGDERDAVIFTIGADGGADGGLRYRFGPIDRVGGERWLNVAISRARRRMTVVSSFRAADLDPTRLTSEGARMLRRYLADVESGGADPGVRRAGPPALTSFEVDLLERIGGAGIPASPHHGVSGHRIELALGHPTRTGEMVLAVEADGGTYASPATTRDRHRLRQDQLERLGWSYLRVWSTEWIRHPERELERIVTAWRAAVERSDRRHAAAGAGGAALAGTPLGEASEPSIRLPQDPTIILTDQDAGTSTRGPVPRTF